MPQSHDLQLFVDRLTLRSVLNADEQRAVLALPARVMHVPARQDFVHENEETVYSCYIASGMVGRFGQTVAGQRQITAFHIPGDMVDLHSAVRPVGVGGLTALNGTTILRIPHDAIRAVAARHPAVAEAFWRDCMLDAAILNQWVVNVGQRDARTRLAHIFCEMAIRSAGGGVIKSNYEFVVTQAQLGEAAALTSVHVNRTLKRLDLENLVTAQRGKVHIPDWDKLALVAEFDPTYLIADTGPQRAKRLFAA